MDKVQLEKVNDSNKAAFINLFNLFHHNRAKFLPDMYSLLMRKVIMTRITHYKL